MRCAEYMATREILMIICRPATVSYPSVPGANQGKCIASGTDKAQATRVNLTGDAGRGRGFFRTA